MVLLQKSRPPWLNLDLDVYHAMPRLACPYNINVPASSGFE